VRLIALVGLALLVSGCASGPIGSYQPSLDSLTSIRSERFGRVRIGEMVPAPELPPERDRSVGVRGHTLTPAEGRSFAGHLAAALRAEFTAAGKFDAASPVEVSGELLRNELRGGGSSTASAALGARFIVKRAGVVVFDKPITVEREWKSAFMGAIAIPDAINQYGQIYRTLVETVLADEEFAAATRTGE
jgi:hypothetical protein